MSVLSLSRRTHNTFHVAKLRGGGVGEWTGGDARKWNRGAVRVGLVAGRPWVGERGGRSEYGWIK